MTIEEQLKQEILLKYKSIRAFTTSINIPYSTLDSVFKRGIANAGVASMIRVFNALDLDIESVQSGNLQHKHCKPVDNQPTSRDTLWDTLTPDERQLLKDYRSMNPQGQEYIRQTMYMAVPMYKKMSDPPCVESQA